VRVVEYEVFHMMGLKRAKLKMPENGIVLIGGENGHGKTRSIESLLMALCGKSGMDWPDVELAEQDREGWVRVKLSGDTDLHDLEGFTVELQLKKRRGKPVLERFRVLDSAGDEAASPREFLQRLYSLRALDPRALEKAKPAERVKLIKELVGLDFTALDDERDVAYKKRTEVNRDCKMLQGRRSGIEFPDDTPDAPVSVVALVAEKDKAMAHNRAVDQDERALKNMQANDVKLAEEIAKLEERLVSLKEAKAKYVEDIAKQEEIVANAVRIDVTQIQDAIESSEITNAHVAKKLEAARLEKEIHQLEVESQKFTDKIQRIDNEKQRKLEDAKWPLPNMSLDDSGVLLDGLPFEQASSAQRLFASVKVGMALNPKLKLFVSKDGNDLDNKTLVELDEMLKKNGYQMILEFVTRSDADESRCAVVFKDGSQVGLPDDCEDGSPETDQDGSVEAE
jgi:energy-coupling factor transporter ATP-binding protein EcfA2